MPSMQAPVVENNLALAAGAPGRVICGLGTQVFTGIVQNTGGISFNATLVLPGGVSTVFTVPPGGLMKFRNVQLLAVQASVAATISILGVLVVYDLYADFLNALEFALVDLSGLFTTATGPVARAAYYDRNSTTPNVSVIAQNVAPHAQLTRVTYTVPTARKAIITAITIETIRITAAAPVGNVNWLVNANGVTISSGESLDNTVGGNQRIATGCGQIALAGGVINVQDTDAGTGGTVDYFESVAVTEFDA